MGGGGGSNAHGPMLGMGNFDGNGNYDFWDPQHWMLDGLVDFSYTNLLPIESS
jgi:hypothetical protein